MRIVIDVEEEYIENHTATNLPDVLRGVCDLVGLDMIAENHYLDETCTVLNHYSVTAYPPVRERTTNTLEMVATYRVEFQTEAEPG